MSVYVDPVRRWGGKGEFTWPTSCHMYADTLEELHAMATKLRMSLKWFQNDPRLPHYDLRPWRRENAVYQFGAIEHTRRQMTEFMKKVRDGQ